MSLREIVVQGAREHNLKGIDLRVPRGTLTTITGVSGSGKSSLAFDTIFQEGQRRFVESLSAYARQFLGNLEKPKVDRVDGLSPTISIDQKTTNRNPRSTVGTITEIFDHLRLLFARLGEAHCANCGRVLAAQTRDQIADRLLALGAGKRVQILAPIVRGRKGEYGRELEGLRLKGFVRVLVDGEERRLDEKPGKIRLSRYAKHTIEVVIDRLVPDPAKIGRLAEGIETALKMADGTVAATIDDEHHSFSSRFACPDCETDFPELEPRLFSFNSPYGACEACAGLGVARQFDPDLVVADPQKSIRGGALHVLSKQGYLAYARLGPESLEKVAKHFGFTLDQPWQSLTRRQRDMLLFGSGDEVLDLRFEYTDPHSGRTIRGRDKKPLRGIIPGMRRFYEMTKSHHLERYMSETTCEACGGTRLRPEARAVTFRGETITGLIARTIEDLHAFFRKLELTPAEEPIGREVLKEIRERLSFLADVGLGYLPLDRGAATLSGGEAQRVRLATQVGAHLQGVLYVLDEPSIGLHQRDNHRLIETLKRLRDRGNTVFVVEHDRDTMLASDHLVDVGPGAGRAGGEIVAAGAPLDVARHATSLTAAYLRGAREIAMPATTRQGNGEALVVRGARQHNLKGIDVAFPLGCFVAVTGVSGSGKSTLVDVVLKRALARRLHGARDPSGEHEAIDGIEHVDKVIEIDQKPIGRTPRSNPATYSGAFDHVRDLFTLLPESRARGYKKGRFSFNVPGGRCEECFGAGVRLVEMQFLADVEIPCDACAGLRYNRETLEIAYKGKTISEVLSMTVDEAAAFFAAHPPLKRILDTLQDVGLGYVELGQTATTLSGGEAQRLKLATELARPGTGRTLYILDEPTTGLHFADVERLLAALQTLVDRGNTVVVIEHNLDVVKVADHVIDLGPEGGGGGGRVVFAGTPRAMMECAASFTGAWLARYVEPLALPKRRSGKAKGDRNGHADEPGAVRVVGAAKNNLRRVDVEIPHGALTVVTGLSGSGKTSLAFDTVFAEAQRRFVESMSTYARRFLSRLDRAPVERIEGLAPAIAIDRRATSKNPRSTVATSTEIHDYLRVLFARTGTPHCPRCSRPLVALGPTAAARAALERFAGARVRVLAPLFAADWQKKLTLAAPKELAGAAADLAKEGFARVVVDGAESRLDEPLPAGLARARRVELVIDRLGARADDDAVRTRLADALDQAYAKGHGVAVVRAESGDELVLTRMPGCPEHDHFLDGEMSPRLFSFNSHLGACPRCDGIGRAARLDVDRLFADPSRPLLKGALVEPWNWALGKRRFGLKPVLKALAKRLKFDLDAPFDALPGAAQQALLRGCDEAIAVSDRRATAHGRRSVTWDARWSGIVGHFEQRFAAAEEGKWWRRALLPLMVEGPCGACDGERLNPLARAVTVGGRTIGALARMTVADARSWFDALALGGSRGTVAADVVREIDNRLAVLDDIGLGYLELARPSATLSGGEAQRIRLAAQLGNRLVGVLYVLDEPTIGLHPRDTARLVATLKGLRDLGNTILVVEHDLDVIRAADRVIDVGPGAGHRGGTIVSAGTVAEVARDKASLTGAYLRGERSVDITRRKGAAARRSGAGEAIELRGAELHNLKRVDARFPLGAFTCVTGVSGSGKSTLVLDVLEPALRRRLERGAVRARSHLPGEPFASLTLPVRVRDLVTVDQSPLGVTPSSNPATYTGVFDLVRKVFASTPEARMRGFTAARFSFNQRGGRCEACEGKGAVQVEMHFLSDVYVPCEACGGKRFDRETLAVTYGGKSISDVLDMEVDEAAEFFRNHRRIHATLALLADVGLGYLRLGQPATHLSGGEAQRVRLAAELARAQQGETLYLLDEPTTGLHPEDVQKLLDVLGRLVDAGNTVVVIEHNPDVIRSASHVVDLGPEGGDAGGRIVVQGTPDEVARCRESHTGKRLKQDLRGGPRRTMESNA